MIKEIFKLVMNSKDINKSVMLLHQIFKEGYSTYDIVNSMYKVVMQIESELNKQKFMELMKQMAELKKRVFEGAVSEIQVAGFLAKCCLIE
jgi:DNA polymerase III delta prime subunit